MTTCIYVYGLNRTEVWGALVEDKRRNGKRGEWQHPLDVFTIEDDCLLYGKDSRQIWDLHFVRLSKRFGAHAVHSLHLLEMCLKGGGITSDFQVSEHAADFIPPGYRRQSGGQVELRIAPPHLQGEDGAA